MIQRPTKETELSSNSAPDHHQQIQGWVERYERPLLSYALKMNGGNREAAQDAVQETFLRLCREDSSLLEGRIAAWLFTVCRTRVIDMQRLHTPQVLKPDQMSQVESEQGNPCDAAEQVDEQRRLATLVADLPARQKEVLRLRLQAGLSYREIAEVTGITVSNVGVQLHAAVTTLRSRLRTN